MAEENQQTTAQPGMHPSFMRVLNQKQEIKKKLAGIKHKIGVYSAKGGVGKTTVAVNLAFALSSMGFKVGLLDADVDTPNVNLFLGITGVVEAQYPLKPIDKDGVSVISTAMFVDDEKKPIIWRGPMMSKMIGEFFDNTDWGVLDYLILDLPPGSSDVPLSIMQILDLDGFVLVTTPQHIAAVNTIRSGRMIKRMNLSVLGVVENMSDGTARGGKEVADAFGCEVIGVVRENKKFSEFSDSGVVAVMKDAKLKEEFIAIAKRIAG